MIALGVMSGVLHIIGISSTEGLVGMLDDGVAGYHYILSQGSISIHPPLLWLAA
jgi:hypothetical protein